MKKVKGDNLNLFSEELTSELEGILALMTNAKQSDVEIQTIGRHIAQFVFLKEILGAVKPGAKGGLDDKERMSWV